MAKSAVKRDSFQEYIAATRSVWEDGKDPQLPFKIKGLMENLLTSTSPDEPWMAQLIREAKPIRELHRDPDYGFIQMGHVQPEGLFHSPHDHGPCWVVYGAYSGISDITHYQRVDDGKESGRAVLKERQLHRLSRGVVHPYLVGDIHSTRAVEGPAVIFRFLSYDLEKVMRYRYNLEKETISLV